MGRFLPRRVGGCFGPVSLDVSVEVGVGAPEAAFRAFAATASEAPEAVLPEAACPEALEAPGPLLADSLCDDCGICGVTEESSMSSTDCSHGVVRLNGDKHGSDRDCSETERAALK